MSGWTFFFMVVGVTTCAKAFMNFMEYVEGEKKWPL